MALFDDGALSFSEEGAVEMAGADDLPVTPSRMRRLALVRSSSFILVVVSGSSSDATPLAMSCQWIRRCCSSYTCSRHGAEDI